MIKDGFHTILEDDYFRWIKNQEIPRPHLDHRLEKEHINLMASNLKMLYIRIYSLYIVIILHALNFDKVQCVITRYTRAPLKSLSRLPLPCTEISKLILQRSKSILDFQKIIHCLLHNVSHHIFFYCYISIMSLLH